MENHSWFGPEEIKGILTELENQEIAIDQHVAMCVTDTGGNITYVNDKFCVLNGYAREELLGNKASLLKSGTHDAGFFRAMWERISQGEVWQGIIRNRRKDGAEYCVEATVTPFKNTMGEIYEYVSLYTDVTELENIREALSRSNLDLEQRVAERAADLLEANRKLAEDMARMLEYQKEVQSSHDQLKALNEQLKAAQNQLLQSEKMASIGQLAAGVAHEINNPIGYVNSNLGTLEKYLRDLFTMLDAYREAEPLLAAEPATAASIRALREKLDLDFLREDISALMSESGHGIARVKKIVQDLKDFSHTDENEEWQWTDLHQCLESTLNVVWNEIKYKAEVVRQYGELPQVECLPFQLNQVFMNLLVNAAHAIEERGIIFLRSGIQGDGVWIEISDSGCGIAPENLNRIFDPFFTTKPVGKGTGLGLSLSWGIVEKHGGRINVASEPGTGTTFRLWLPVTHSAGKTELGDNDAPHPAGR
jgi:PAS domain S-box-containing protein